MRFVEAGDPDEEFETDEQLVGEEPCSVSDLLAAGFSLERCTLLHDGSVSDLFLCERNGRRVWFSLRYD